MDFIQMEGANVVLAEGQDEYTTLVGVFDANTQALHATSGEVYDSGPSITVALRPTPEELTCLLNGGTIYLRVSGGSFPPVALWAE